MPSRKRIRLEQERHGHDLLLTSLRAPATMERLPPQDWDLLIRMARRVKLLGHLGYRLQDQDLLDRIPPRAAAQIGAIQTLIARHRQVALWELNRVMQVLTPLGEPIVLLKGCAYLALDLPFADSRLLADVDFMVSQQGLSKVERTLAKHGWVGIKLDPYDQRYYRRWMHELPPMRHQTRETEVDIHHTILPRTGRLRPDADELLAQARPVPGGNTPMLKVLAPTDMVLHTTVHLFQDGELRDALRELVDLDRMLRHFARNEPGFWEELVPRARRLDLQRPLFYGLHFSRAMLGTPVPKEVMEAAGEGAPNRLVLKLMERLVPLALLPEHPESTRWLTGRARWLLYLRSHWLRMPPLLLARHLFHKAFLSHRKAPETPAQQRPAGPMKAPR